MGKTGGERDEKTGKVVTGKMPKGHSVEEPKVTKHFGLPDTIRHLIGK